MLAGSSWDTFHCPLEEARNIKALLIASAPYAAIDPCAGDGSA